MVRRAGTYRAGDDAALKNYRLVRCEHDRSLICTSANFLRWCNFSSHALLSGGFVRSTDGRPIPSCSFRRIGAR